MKGIRGKGLPGGYYGDSTFYRQKSMKLQRRRQSDYFNGRNNEKEYNKEGGYIKDGTLKVLQTDMAEKQ